MVNKSPLSVDNRARAWAHVDPNHAQTYRNVVATHLQSMSNAIGPHTADAARQIDLVASLLGGWADDPAERFDRHHSFAANDGSPVEFSFAMARRKGEQRLLFEPLDSTQDPPRQGLAGHQFVDRLDRVLNIDVSRFRLVANLFAAEPSSGSFSMLCSAALQGGDIPLFKVYWNPAVGQTDPLQTVTEAMSRLRMSEPWMLVRKRLGDGAFDLSSHQIALFAIDLGGAPNARVKVYLRHADCGTDATERVAALAPDYQPDLFSKILHRVYDGSVKRLPKAPMTCLSFRQNCSMPTSATLYCPLDPNIDNDAQARTRIVDLLHMSGIAPDRVSAIATAISGTELASQRRLSWLSYKRPADPVVTVYAGLDGSTR